MVMTPGHPDFGLRTLWSAVAHGKGGSAPNPPDPAATAAAQAGANKEAVRESALVNQIGTIAPWGQTYYTGEVGSPGRTQVTELSPITQQLYNQQGNVATNLMGAAETLAPQIRYRDAFSLSGLPGYGTTQARSYTGDNLPEAPWQRDRAADIARAEQATFDRSYNLLADDLAQEEGRLETRLANKGITLGSDAYRDATSDFRSDRGRRLNDLALASVAAGRAEDSRLFGLGSQARTQAFGEGADLAQLARSEDQRMFANQNALRSQALGDRLLERAQPMNELAAILQGSPAMGAPSPVNPGQYGVQPGDIQGATNLAYQGQLQNWQNRQNNMNSTFGNLLSLGGTVAGALISDRRLKRDIRRVGTLKGGVPLYRYRYVWGGRERVGVMAQDLLGKLPEAVLRIGGIYAVDYGKVLGATR